MSDERRHRTNNSYHSTVLFVPSSLHFHFRRVTLVLLTTTVSGTGCSIESPWQMGQAGSRQKTAAKYCVSHSDETADASTSSLIVLMLFSL